MTLRLDPRFKSLEDLNEASLNLGNEGHAVFPVFHNFLLMSPYARLLRKFPNNVMVLWLQLATNKLCSVCLCNVLSGEAVSCDDREKNSMLKRTEEEEVYDQTLSLPNAGHAPPGQLRPSQTPSQQQRDSHIMREYRVVQKTPARLCELATVLGVSSRNAT